jgi:hypothetical protein
MVPQARVECQNCGAFLICVGDTEKEACDNVRSYWNNHPPVTPGKLLNRIRELERELFEANQRSGEKGELYHQTLGELQRDRSEREKNLLLDIELLQKEVQQLRARRDELTAKLMAAGLEESSLKKIRVHNHVLVDRVGTVWDPEGEVMPPPGPTDEDENYGPFTDLSECLIYVPEG